MKSKDHLQGIVTLCFLFWLFFLFLFLLFLFHLNNWRMWWWILWTAVNYYGVHDCNSWSFLQFLGRFQNYGITVVFWWVGRVPAEFQVNIPDIVIPIYVHNLYIAITWLINVQRFNASWMFLVLVVLLVLFLLFLFHLNNWRMWW